MDDVYKVIAADINNDERISASDLLQLRKLILGIIVELPTNDPYRMIVSSQEFSDINDPWPVQEGIVLQALNINASDQNFVAVKVGDVNRNATFGFKNTTTESTSRSNIKYGILLDSAMDEASDVQSVNILSEKNSTLLGLQISLNIEGMENVSLTSAVLNITSADYSVNGSVLNISWSSPNTIEVNKNDVLFTVSGTAEAIVDLSINANTNLTAEAYNDNLEIMNIEIHTRELVDTKFDVFQNEPNPFEDQTVIRYTLSLDGPVSISIIDISGKIVYVNSKVSKKGNGQFLINAATLDQSGVYYYSIKTDENIITKKMIFIK